MEKALADTSLKIPKLIHYVWVGPNQPEHIQHYISTWEEQNPDFEIKRWSERDLDLSIPFVKYVYERGYWALVANYLRLLAVYTDGGIYMDTDFLAVRPFDGELLSKNCFYGFQLESHPLEWVNNAIFGAVPRHWFVKKCLDYVSKDLKGPENPLESSPRMTTKFLKAEGLKEYKKPYTPVKDIAVYAKEYFYPFSWDEEFNQEKIPAEAYAVHMWEKSWVIK